MEERLRLYRERYGASGEPKPAGGKSSAQQQPRSGQERKRPEARKAPVQRSTAPASAPASVPAPAPKGILGAIKGLFGKKDE